MGISTLTSKGTFTIPEEIRVALGAQTGDKILVNILDVKSHQATFTIIPTKNIVEELYGSLKTSVKFISHNHEMEMAGKALAKKYGVS